MEKLPFVVREGRILGRDHAQRGKSCQDGSASLRVTIRGHTYIIGAVSDGCGQGKHSEVAGSLLPLYVVQQVAHLLRFEIPIEQIPATLYPHVIGFLEAIRKQIPFVEPQKVIQFIGDYLLATIVGFVVGGEGGVVFAAGDGFWVINEEITEIECGNQSPYIGYHLTPRSALKDDAQELPWTFATRSIETKNLERLAVATDGWTEGLLERMWEEARAGPLGIQLFMNWINGPRNPNPNAGLFYDDAAIVALERAREEVEDA